MNEEKDIHEEDLSKIAPTLAQLKKEQAFKVPANYFDELPSIIQDRAVPTGRQVTSSEKSVFESWKELFLQRILAPSLAMMIIIAISLFMTDFDPVDNQFAELTAEEIISEETIEDLDIDEYLITETLASAESIDEYSEEIIPEKTEIVVNTTNNEEEEIIEYLLENEIEINDIINYL